MFLTHALRAIYRAAVTTGDTLWKYVSLLISGTPPAVTFISDASTSGNVLTLNGDTRPSNFNPYTPGYYSNFFDGTGDAISAPASTTTNFETSNFTIEAWVYLTAGGSFRRIYSLYGSAGATQVFLRIETANTIRFYTIPNVVDYTSTVTLTLNTWNHIAVVRNGSAFTTYLNGVSVASATSSAAMPTTTTLPSFISGLDASSELWLGYISNLRVVKGTAVYTAAFTPPTAPLTAISGTSLLTCQSNRLIDNSLNNFVITKNGDTTVSGFTPFTIPTILNGVTTTYLGSGYFDGNDYISGSVAFTLGASDFCIEAWGYWTSFNNGTYGSPIMAISRATPSGQITLRANKSAASSTSANYYSIDNGTFIPSAGYQTGVSAGTIYLNQWTHIALTRQGSTFRMFINGVLVSTQTDATAFGTAFTTVYIGSDSPPANGYMTGWVTDARVVVGSAIYTASFAPPAQPLTAVTNTKLLTLQTDQPVANKQFVDNSGNNFPITQVGNATQGTFSPYGANWSNYFDGTGDYLQTPASSTTALIGGTGLITTTSTLTIECWIYQTQRHTTAGYPVMFGDMGTTGSIYWGFGPSSTGLLTFYWYTGAEVRATGSDTIPLNTWTHIAVSISSGAIKLFVNGNLQTITGSSTTGNQSGTYGYLSLGMFNTGGAAYAYYGYVSNLRITRSALYTAAFTPPTAPLTPIAGTSLLTCQDNRFVDDSPNNFTITRAGDVSVQRFSPFSPVIQTPTTYSTFFDGTGDYLSTPVGLNTAMGNGFAGNIITIENWIYPTSFPSTNAYSNGLIGAYAAVSANGRWWFGIRGSVGTTGNLIFVWTTSTSGEANVISTSNSVILNQWNHVAVTINATNSTNTTINMFVNGILVNTFTGNNFSTQTAYYTSPSIGGNYSIYVNNYVGYISNFRIVTGTAVYTANFTPPTAPLTAIANTSLLTCQSATHIDNSTNAFTITQAGDATPRLFNPFGFTNTTTGTAFTPALYAGSAYFDGTGDYLATPATGQFVATGDFTIQFSFYLTSLAATNHLIGNYTAAVATDWILEVINTGVMQVFLDGSTQRLGHSGITVGQWYHVSITRSGTTVTGRINGAPFNTTPTYTMSGTFGTATKAIFMGMRGGSTNPLFGYLTDVSLVNGTALYKGSFVPPLAPVTATAGTTLLLNMDKGAAIDSSRSNNLETVGDAKVTYETPYAGSYYSNYFDGTGDFLAASSSTFSTTGDLTLEGWAYVTSASNYAGIASMRDSTSGNGISLTILNTGYLEWSFGQAAGNFYQSTLCPLNQWFHIALVRSGSSTNNCSCYLNGTRVAQFTSNLEANGAANTFLIGRYYATGTSQYFLNGYVSNLRYVKGTALYSGTTYTVPTSPLTAISGTSLLTCQSKSFVDNSSNAFAITRNGDVAVKSQNPFQKSTYSSMFFDGTGDYLNIPTIPTAFVFGSSDFTIEFWTYFASSPAATVWAGNFNNNATAAGVWTCYYYAAGEIAFFYNSGVVYKVTYALVPGQWYHIAFVRSGTTIKIFVNGAQVGTTGTISASITTANLQSGGWNIGRSNDAAAYLNGYMADLRITNSARTTGTTFPVPTAPLPTS